MFEKALHLKYIKELDNKKDSLEYWLSEHLRLNGVYWAITALDIIGEIAQFDKETVIKYVMSCQSENGGFGGHVGHDAHLLYTLSAIQILATYDAIDTLDIEKVAKYISDLQNLDGSFAGDEWGETDTRFSYCAISALSLLKKLDTINLKTAAEYIHSCRNFDGGYGSMPGAESHSGALTILDRLELIDKDQLCFWLSERQLPCGGFNGRPEKLEDVCYSWWVLSCLKILNRDEWISKDKLKEFILNCQDKSDGGISDRPGNRADIFHTLFGFAALSMLGYESMEEIDPRYCMTKNRIDKLGLSS